VQISRQLVDELQAQYLQPLAASPGLFLGKSIHQQQQPKRELA
jgi:hypothetical protein